MERVSTLIHKLQKQFDEKAPAKVLMHTVQMLQAELESQAEGQKEIIKDKVTVIMPRSLGMFRDLISDSPDTLEEKTIEVLKVDEKEIEEELEQIKRNADAVNSMGASVKHPFVYDPIEDVPTLAHQTPLDVPLEKMKLPDISASFEYPESLNDRLKQAKIELSEKLTDAPIKDLKKAIGVNDRFLFINELFRGDEAMYERSIKTIQNFSILAEAEFWIKRELKVKIGWHDNHPVVKQFDQLIRRRFN
jgi:hypothetical protein